jgi:hypothetical protein
MAPTHDKTQLAFVDEGYNILVYKMIAAPIKLIPSDYWLGMLISFQNLI